jgi:hypothetical protein
MLQRKKSKFAEVISLNGQNILFALKENAIHQHSNLGFPVRSPTLIGLDFPLTTLVHIASKRNQFLTTHRKQQEQNLSNYAQQYLSKVTKRSPLDMQRLLQD